MDVVVGNAYKVKPGFNVFVKCNIYEGGTVVVATDDNLKALKLQAQKLDLHSGIGKQAIYPNKMMKTHKTK